MSPIFWVYHFEKVQEYSLLLNAIKPTYYRLSAKYSDLISTSNFDEIFRLPMYVLTYFLKFLNINLLVKFIN